MSVPVIEVTVDGRAALQRWAADDLPKLRDRCVGWADVFDARRAAPPDNPPTERTPCESPLVSG